MWIKLIKRGLDVLVPFSYFNGLVELGQIFIVDKLNHLLIETTLFTHSESMNNGCDYLKFYFIVVMSVSKGIVYQSRRH